MEQAPIAPVIPEDPFGGATVAAPRTLLPTVLAEAAAAAPLMARYADRDPAVRLNRWYETFESLLNGKAVGDAEIRPAVRPSVFEKLLVAYHPGEVSTAGADREAFELLQRLGVVTLAGDTARLTPLGVWGLFQFCGWTDDTPWILEVGEWRSDLTAPDLDAWLLAMAEKRLRQQSSWLETADPAVFAEQLVDLMIRAEGLVRTAAFAFLLRLGSAAVPAVLELADTELIGWAWMWAQNNGMQLPRELTKAEQAQATREFMPALAALQAQFLELTGQATAPATLLDGDGEQAVLLRRHYGLGEPLSNAERTRLAQLFTEQNQDLQAFLKDVQDT
jgi:hypothetical protein